MSLKKKQEIKRFEYDVLPETLNGETMVRWDPIVPNPYEAQILKVLSTVADKLELPKASCR